MTWKRISAVIGAVLLMGSVISGYVWFDTKYASAADVQRNAIEIRINSLKDDIRWYQDQMAYIMNRCGVRDPKDLPDHAYQNYNDYQLKKEELEKQLQILFQKRNS